MTLITASDLEKSFGQNLLFSNVSFDIRRTDKIGFIGANGTGKTTLVKIITGEEDYDGGRFSKKSGLKIGYLEQHACQNSEHSVFEEALLVFDNLLKLEEELKKISNYLQNGENETLIEKQDTLNNEFIEKGGLVFRSKTRSTLLGLGFTENEIAAPVSFCSGGQKSKIGLAKLLLSEPQLLLLDEPTNHLDIESVMWLEEYLEAFEGAALIISHDRYFLDRVTNRTFELKHQKLYSNDYSYSKHTELEKEREKFVAKEYENSVKEIKRIEGIIAQQRTFSMERNYRTIDHKQKSIDRIKETLVAPEQTKKQIHFNFEVPSPSGNDVLLAENLSCAFGDHTLYNNITVNIKKGDRAFLLGANGTGKTTLIKQLLNDSRVKLGANVTIGYFDQLGLNLNFDATVLEELQNCYPQMLDSKIRTALALFLFVGDDVFKKISTLSGGERARVALCKIMLSSNNLLLLDEPTNHLDIKSREALENALGQFDGTLIMVSHDRYFINKLSTKILYLENEQLHTYFGDYDYFLQHHKKSMGTEVKPLREMGKGGQEFKAKKQKLSEIRKLKTAISRLEAEVTSLEEEIAKTEELLNLEEVTSDYQKTLEASNKLDELTTKLESVLTEWDLSTSQLESLEQEG